MKGYLFIDRSGHPVVRCGEEFDGKVEYVAKEKRINAAVTTVELFAKNFKPLEKTTHTPADVASRMLAMHTNLKVPITPRARDLLTLVSQHQEEEVSEPKTVVAPRTVVKKPEVKEEKPKAKPKIEAKKPETKPKAEAKGKTEAKPKVADKKPEVKKEAPKKAEVKKPEPKAKPELKKSEPKAEKKPIVLKHGASKSSKPAPEPAPQELGLTPVESYNMKTGEHKVFDPKAAAAKVVHKPEAASKVSIKADSSKPKKEASERAPRGTMTGQKITVTGKALEGVRPGTVREALMKAVMASKTTDEAMSKTVQNTNGSPMKINATHIKFAVELGIVKVG